jgi:hypothetical protein
MLSNLFLIVLHASSNFGEKEGAIENLEIEHAVGARDEQGIIADIETKTLVGGGTLGSQVAPVCTYLFDIPKEDFLKDGPCDDMNDQKCFQRAFGFKNGTRSYDWDHMAHTSRGAILNTANMTEGRVEEAERVARKWMEGQRANTATEMTVRLRKLLSKVARPSTAASEQLSYEHCCPNPEPAECGAGCQINSLVPVLMKTIRTHQNLGSPISKFAKGSDLGKFFMPWSTAAAACRRRKLRESTKTNDMPKLWFPDWLEPGDRRQYFWFISQIISFITAPGPSLQKRLGVQLKALNFAARRPVLGMHVRLGE